MPCDILHRVLVSSKCWRHHPLQQGGLGPGDWGTVASSERVGEGVLLPDAGEPRSGVRSVRQVLDVDPQRVRGRRGGVGGGDLRVQEVQMMMFGMVMQ